MANNQKEGRWYAVKEYASKKREVKIESKNVVIEGVPDELMVVRIDDKVLFDLTKKGGNKAIEYFLGTIRKILSGVGFSCGIIVVPSGVEFLKLKKVTKEELEELQRSSSEIKKPKLQTLH